jgi:excisionase family DNA binding protein
MMSKSSDKSYMTPNEVAEMLMISVAAVRQWAQKCELKALTTPGGHRRFLRQDVLDFADKRGIKLAKKSKRQVKILIVDDNQALSRFMVALLSSPGSHFVTEQAFDGFEAGQKIQLFRPDIVLLDLMMPGLSGTEVCKNLKRNPLTQNIRVIAMTGFATPENIEEILTAGAEICLAKPVDQAKLLKMLNQSVMV